MREQYPDLSLGESSPHPEKRKHYAIHPLFPLPEGVRETKEIYQISFDRWDHAGKKERCPDRFLASDLDSLRRVIDRFGGGTYQFFAFDRRGNYSRWMPEREKVWVNLPCKPLRPPASLEATATPSRKPTGAGPDLVALLMASQARTDRIITALLDRLAAPPAQPASARPASPSPPTAQPVDMMSMLAALATVIEKLRPPSAGTAEQLGALVTVAQHMAKDTPAPPAPSPPPPSPPPAMVWAYIPGFGPALMRPDQAQKVAQLGSPPPPRTVAPAATVTDSNPRGFSWDDVAVRLKDPREQVAFKTALERAIAATASIPTPVAPLAPPHVPAPVPASVATRVQERAAVPPPAPVPASIATRVEERAALAPIPVPALPRPVPPPYSAPARTPTRVPAPVPALAVARATPPPPAPAPTARETPLPTPAPDARRLTESAPDTTSIPAPAVRSPRRARSRSRHRTGRAFPACPLRRAWLWGSTWPQPPPITN